ncbi:MAG: alpha/beta hydrolase domain-containing protein [Candidatus Korobacteraceae bacterium]
MGFNFPEVDFGTASTGLVEACQRAKLARMPRKLASVLLLIICAVSFAGARVIRVEITSRNDVLGSKAFGDVGPYEQILGRVYYVVPAANPHNQRIVDLDKAVNLKNGEVEFSAEFVVVHPKDPKRGNGSMLLEVPNRGRARIIALVDGGTQDLKDVGDAWLLRNGYTVAAVGWQWDATGPDALHIFAPIAKDHGKSITGLLRGDFTLAKPLQDVPLGHYFPATAGGLGGSEYPVAAPDDLRNMLTVRDRPNSKRALIPRSQWQFAHMVNGKLETSNRHIHLNGGFQPGKIYEYVYVVQDPVIAGLSFAAIRDFASYAKHDPEAIAPVVRVHAEGISQNGRFLRDMLYQGFNADEEGRIALDGVLAHIAGAGVGSFNYRFCQPSRDSQPMSSIFWPTDIFPFTDLPETDPRTREKASLLDRARSENVVPKIFFSHTSYEYWGRATSLIHTTADGKRDMPISDNVRIYMYTGLQHTAAPFPPEKGSADMLGQQPQTPLPINFFWRAMIANMDAWVRSNTPPPASKYPKIADGNLAPLNKSKFPAIPGINRPKDMVEARPLDFGPNWRSTGILTVQPPKVGKPYPALVPQVDADGNDLGGIQLPAITVPLATYTGWNLRDPSISASEQRVSFEGSYIPLPKTAEQRQRSGDPRKSIAERYTSRQEYLKRYEQAVSELVGERYILDEDRGALLKRGGQEWDLATK